MVREGLTLRVLRTLSNVRLFTPAPHESQVFWPFRWSSTTPSGLEVTPTPSNVSGVLTGGRYKESHFTVTVTGGRHKESHFAVTEWRWLERKVGSKKGEVETRGHYPEGDTDV